MTHDVTLRYINVITCHYDTTLYSIIMTCYDITMCNTVYDIIMTCYDTV